MNAPILSTERPVMRLHARLTLAAAVSLTAFAGPVTPASYAADPMTLTDLGSMFSPPAWTRRPPAGPPSP